MGKIKKETTSAKSERRYWTEPKVPVGLRLSAELVERAKKAARERKIPFTALITAGIERELFAFQASAKKGA